MKIKIKEIERDNEIYPRQRMSRKHIESYVEALNAGAIFPPIEIQKIRIKKDDGSNEVKTISLDGLHRLEAYGEYNKLEGVEPIKEIEAEFWKDEVLDKDENLVDLMVRAAELNTKHGLRLSQGDAKNQLQKIAETENALNLTWKDIAKSFDVTPEWASICVSAILAAKRMSRDAFMYRLSLSGWTQAEIGELVDLDQSVVSRNMHKLNEFNSYITSDFYDKGKPVEEIAEYYNLDMPLLWAILLEGKNDKERMELFGVTPKDYDVWTFSERDPRLGVRAPGNIPGQIALNVLHRYTKQGDLVVDPMAGGGSTMDVCLVMNRKWRAYDINPNEERRGIVQNDILEGLPDKAKNCDLFFLDPPYYNKVDEISAFDSTERFYSFLEYLASISVDTVKKGGHVALILSDYLDYDNPLESIFTFRAAAIFEDTGLRSVGHFWCPLSTQQYTASDVVYARDHDRDLQILRECFIFRKMEET